ncbi:MAG: biosynthetic-type acetolactate synthase large subunit [Candidatus Bathyarchaeia archaeon]
MLVVMSGARALMEALKREKVKVVFGIPGGANLPIYDELLNHDVRHVLARHEQCAAHMADGYARASGWAGVCFATSGPGTTNLVTGIANAYMDSSPVIAVTGQVSRPFIGRDAFQETDAIGITAPITKHNIQPSKASEIPLAIRTAFYVATTGRPGPVLIDIPKDVQTEVEEVEFPEKVKIRGYTPYPPIDPQLVHQAVALIANSRKPVILAGGGVKYSNASKGLLELSETLMAPVATSFMGKGAFPEDHPLSIGIVGMHGNPVANKLVQEADLLIGVGFRFSDRTTGKVGEFCSDAKLIHIDIDEAEIGKNKRVDAAIVGDAGEALSMMLKQIREGGFKASEDWGRRLEEVKSQLQAEEEGEGGLKPPAVIKEMRRLLPRNAIVTTEVGQNQMWASLHFKAYMPRTFISSGGLGTMGFGFPAAIGAKVAVPEVPVVDIAGDGSFAMTENSLATSVAENIPVIVVILNNRMLGMVAQWQRLFYDRRYSAVKLDKPDFVKLAEAYGAQGLRPQSLEEFREAFKKALKCDVTTVIDVPIDPEEDVMPMIPPGGGLKDMIEVA